MKKRSKLNNKGFSLVELIIVIAIMAILTGVLAPQLIKYLEKANVSSDIQLASTIQTVLQTSLMDPTVFNEEKSTEIITDLADASKTLADIGVQADSQLAKAMWEGLSVPVSVVSAADFHTHLTGQMKSKITTGATKEIGIQIINNRVTVTLLGTNSGTVDASGVVIPIIVK